jgi:hypothetical protein
LLRLRTQFATFPVDSSHWSFMASHCFRVVQGSGPSPCAGIADTPGEMWLS